MHDHTSHSFFNGPSSPSEMQKEQDNILTPTMFQEQLRAAMGTMYIVNTTHTPTTMKTEENDEAESTSHLCSANKPDEAVMEAETPTETATETDAWYQIVETKAAYHAAISHATDMDSILAMRSANPSITEAELKGVREICESAKSAVATMKGVYMERVLSGMNAAEAEAAKAQAEAEAAGKAATTAPALKDFAKAYARYAKSHADKVEAFKKLLDELVLDFDESNLDGA
jgi:hypothetical protein